MLRKIRVALAVIFGILITLLFLDISGVLHKYFAFTAEWQFVPALLALNVVVLVALVLLTLIFGRVYCSVICPTGIFQDVVAFFARKIKPRKKRKYTYSSAKTVLRWVILGIFIVGIIAGIAIIPALLDPYAAYGRMVAELLAPVYNGVNNLFVNALGDSNYTFSTTEVWMKAGVSFGLAILTLFIIGYLAWRNGRTYCNTICPVGTIIGYLSKFSFLKIQIDPATCTKCGRCTRDCKASCIDFKNHMVDHSRCVACFDCIDSCRDNSIFYTRRLPEKKAPVAVTTDAAPADNSRRQFFATSLLIAGTAAQLKAQENKRSMIKYPAIRKDRSERSVPVSPPGSGSHGNLNDKCTACLLCVAQCPDKIIRPSVNEYGWTAIMQPTLSFEKGYCRTTCTACTDVCPTDAIQKLLPENKTKVAMGHAVYVRENCIVVKDDVNCDGCWRICPTDAITREYRDGGAAYIEPTGPDADTNTVNLRLVPVVNKDKCIGCGACEYICPARPLSAIYVEGYREHLAVN